MQGTAKMRSFPKQFYYRMIYENCMPPLPFLYPIKYVRTGESREHRQERTDDFTNCGLLFFVRYHNLLPNTTTQVFMPHR